MDPHPGEKSISLLEVELQEQSECFEQLYRVTLRQQDLLRSGLVDEVLSANRDKDRLMVAIRLHTERLAQLHETGLDIQRSLPDEVQDRILQKVRRLSNLAHQILDLEKENFSIAVVEQARAQSRLKGVLPDEDGSADSQDGEDQGDSRRSSSEESPVSGTKRDLQ